MFGTRSSSRSYRVRLCRYVATFVSVTALSIALPTAPVVLKAGADVASTAETAGTLWAEVRYREPLTSYPLDVYSDWNGYAAGTIGLSDGRTWAGATWFQANALGRGETIEAGSGELFNFDIWAYPTGVSRVNFLGHFRPRIAHSSVASRGNGRAAGPSREPRAGGPN